MNRKLVGMRVTSLFIGILFLLITPSTFADAPSSVIEKLQAELLSVMKNAKKLGFDGRYKQLLPVVTETLDIPFIARYTLGSSWKSLTDEQSIQFVDAFQILSISDYARHFDGYSNEEFNIEGEYPLKKGGMRVRSRLTNHDDTNVIFDYLLRNIDGNWRIVNVIADGVSDLAVRRTEYRQVIKTQGYDALLDQVKEKSKQYREAAIAKESK
ncbi:ABC transporter substrate-binding protein [Candidatus Nitrosacidococcus sp. I8]|uniref:ABC transporter substrate-binding protein n=1 Tax=Candidatus Nitrosacidococcus sp. I8 TaxID=2942908 RepID=UPI0022277CD8|nr:ABC transporter substrate-binding protein [Candidatus Nitrosacidococcus sp. I8]CAH9018006.1 hypothetical protein NURINAE_00674 [Candidatus Nitrosacidococcus sp. I8]